MIERRARALVVDSEGVDTAHVMPPDRRSIIRIAVQCTVSTEQNRAEQKHTLSSAQCSDRREWQHQQQEYKKKWEIKLAHSFS